MRTGVARALRWLIVAVLLVQVVGYVRGTSAGLTAHTSNPSSSFGATALTPPTSLIVSGSAGLSWTATTSSWATGSRVFRSTVSGGPYTQIAEIANLSTTTYADNPGSGTFYYVVQSYYGGNGANWTSVDSNQASVTIVSCSSPGSQTVVADSDSWVYQVTPTTNSGTDTTLYIQSYNTSRNSRTLVHFALPAVPPGCAATGATLRLNSTLAITGRTLQVYQASAAWTELGVTWSNQPATTGPAVTTTSATGWRTWAVTSQVQAMYTGANYGFVLRDSVESGAGQYYQGFASREAATNKPELVITFS